MKKIVLGVLMIFGCFFKPALHAQVKSWAVSYNPDTPVKDFEPYDVVVVDSDYPAENVKALKDKGKEVFGYVSIGEIRSDRAYYNNFKPYFLGNNPNWTDEKQSATCVDPRAIAPGEQKPAWPTYVLKTILPALYKKDFDGVVLDTMDSILALEAGWVDWSGKKPEELQGMTKVLVQMVYDMKLNFPGKKIFPYRALDLFNAENRKAVFFKEETDAQFKEEAKKWAQSIDYMLLENVLSEYTAKEGKDYFIRRSDEEIDADVALVDIARAFNPNLLVLSLDYWDLDDKDGVRKIYEEQRKRSYVPYVGIFDLMSVIPEPK